MNGPDRLNTNRNKILPGNSSQPLVALRGVEKTYTVAGETVKALRSTDLELRAGDFVVVTGRSGSGKTTLLNLVAGLARPSKGSVHLAGADIWSLSDRRRTRLRSERIGFVFQFPSLVPNMNVEENVLLPATFTRDRDRSGRELQVRASHLIETVGLSDKRRARPAQLSAGQQQRVVIARALLAEPALLVADEPTSNLDETTEDEVLRLIRAANSELGVTVLMVTHSLDLVGHGTRHVFLEAGTAVDRGNR